MTDPVKSWSLHDGRPTRLLTRGVVVAAEACAAVHLFLLWMSPSILVAGMALLSGMCALCGVDLWRDPMSGRAQRSMAVASVVMLAVHGLGSESMHDGRGATADRPTVEGAARHAHLHGASGAHGAHRSAEVLMTTGVVLSLVVLVGLAVVTFFLRSGIAVRRVVGSRV